MFNCSPVKKVPAPAGNQAPEATTEKNTDEKNISFMTNLLGQFPQFFDSIVAKKDEYRLQIIYTQVDRGRNNMPKFTNHYFNVQPDQYFYPASTIKLPIAILALQKLHELKIPGLNRNTTMITETAFSGQTAVYNDPASEDGRPTIANYIKKILLVSDNDASNRLYEFLGQEYINTTLHKMGFDDAQILHRLSIGMTEEENRNTNPIRFLDAEGKLIYEKPAETSRLDYEKRNTRLGKGYFSGGQLKNEPFDFSGKNRLTLETLHGLLKSIIFPEAVSRRQRFNLDKEDYIFLRKYMSMFCTESKYPSYNSPDYWDTYVKFLFYGTEKQEPEPDIRIFNKVGDAYGFLTDIAYIVDYNNNIEFLLSATIHCNRDSIYNDDKYEYETVGFPFMKNLGRIIYEHELKRLRKYKPDLSTSRPDYNN